MDSKCQMERMDAEAIARFFPEIIDAFSSSGVGRFVFFTHIPENYSYWSKDAVEYFGLPSSEMKDPEKIWLEHIAQEDRKRFLDNLHDVFEGRSDIHEVVYRAKNRDGRYITCSCRGKMLRDEDGNPKYFAGMIVNHENTELIDPVTGLYTREMLLEHLENAVASGKKQYLWAMGVHNFFDINNRYGYDFGNKVLKAIAEYGLNMGTEFILYRPEGTKMFAMGDCDHFTIEQMKVFHQATRDFCRKNLVVDGVHITVDVCSALMVVGDESIPVNSIYNNTLYALDKAKRQGMHGMFVVDSNEFSGNEKHLRVLSEIRECIEKDFEGFFLCYQPIVDAHTERPTGMESLIRWKSPKRGIVPPNEFIPWLEQDPLFFELGNWIIRTAINDTKPILEQNPDFVVNVNLAYPQVQRSDFKATLNRIVKECDFPADSLKLELTERCRLLDTDTLRNDMAFFKSEGMQTALDDFGTGYAALNLLTELPVDQIKIDKSFIDNIRDDVPKQCLLRALTSCACELGKTVCVEGIETREMADYIKDNYQVSYFQGYFYSRPVPIEQFLEWLVAHE